MEKTYINQKELTQLLGKGRLYGSRVMQYLLKIAVEKQYYIPESKKEILIPIDLVKKELKIKETTLLESTKDLKKL